MSAFFEVYRLARYINGMGVFMSKLLLSISKFPLKQRFRIMIPTLLSV
jgi:hypothetical protein